MQRGRVWITHKFHENFNICPLCGVPLKWKYTGLGEWVPCDEQPILYVENGGNLKLYKRRYLIEGCTIYNPRKHKDIRPQYALIPHFYTCPVLRKERAEWAKSKALAP